jgi:hypothetical protein
MGGIEGGALVPAITAEALFHPVVLTQTPRFASLFEERETLQFRARARSPRVRPPYTGLTLAAALRQGMDSAGRLLDSAMPRYRLSDEDFGNLCAYLETLGNTPPSGLDEASLHFATVITEGVAAADRASLLSILDAWFLQKNRDADYHQRKINLAPWDREDEYRASRRWTLDVWTPRGPPETWTGQLAEFYRRQPVFAIVGGLAAGPWQPMADFCDSFEVPCLFPETSLPARSPERGYTVYFSPGLRGEAAALAAYLRQTGVPASRVFQVYGNSLVARAAAEALRVALPSVAEQALPAVSAPSAEYWQTLIAEKRPINLIIWAGDADLRHFDCAAARVPVYLSTTLLTDTKRMAPCDSVYLTYPYAVSETASMERARMMNWQLSRGISPTNERIQLNAQFAMTLLDYCIAHMSERFSKDYLLETIERETENAPNPGIFPHFGLSAGQRFASKGAYIVRPGASSGLRAVSEWIVP